MTPVKTPLYFPTNLPTTIYPSPYFIPKQNVAILGCRVFLFYLSNEQNGEDN